MKRQVGQKFGNFRSREEWRREEGMVERIAWNWSCKTWPESFTILFFFIQLPRVREENIQKRGERLRFLRNVYLSEQIIEMSNREMIAPRFPFPGENHDIRWLSKIIFFFKDYKGFIEVLMNRYHLYTKFYHLRENSIYNSATFRVFSDRYVCATFSYNYTHTNA